MPSWLRNLLRIFWIGLVWAVAWGVTGAVIGRVWVTFQPGLEAWTAEVPFIFGFPSALLGLGPGLAYGALAQRFGIEAAFGKKGLVVLGVCIVSATCLIVLLILMYAYKIVLVTVLLAAVILAGLYLWKRRKW
jgi:hypothetical protein